MFWEKFSYLCEKEGKAPNRIAEEASLFSSTMVTKYKKGAVPSGDILVKVADYFGVSVDYLLGRESKLHTQTESEWDVILNQMSDDSLLMFREYAKFLLWRQAQAARDSL